MNFIEELRWRGMLHDMTPGAEELFTSGKVITGYIGFDPTAPSMTIGNYVQLMLLNLFQKSGHKPIVLMGGATGRIGDPSFKADERELKSYDELDSNLAFQVEQVKDLLEFNSGSETDAIIINNHDFYKEMNVLEFLRKAGKNLTVSYMLSKESVKKRLETGLSFTEFSYQLLQAYDFLTLFQEQNCLIQMGGSDQWGNITSGTEFIRRNTDGKAYAVTTPLLTKADGSKFGKSEKGNIWLSKELTSPYEFYQFWINAKDEDLAKYIRYFTFKTKDEVEALEKEHENNPNALKRIFAEEITSRIHGVEAFNAAKKVSNLIFGSKTTREDLLSLSAKDFEVIAKEVESFEIEKDSGLGLNELLTEKTNVFSSKSEFRRAVQANSLSANKIKIADIDHIIDTSELIHNEYVMIEQGKKKKYILVFK